MSNEPRAHIGLPCPECGEEQSTVIDTRGRMSGGVRRRRECPLGHRFTTVEEITGPTERRLPWSVKGALSDAIDEVLA